MTAFADAPYVILAANDPRHGTARGYDAHLRNGGAATACGPCRNAAAAYEYRRRIDRILGRTRTTSSIGTARRIQALVALGYTFGQIGREFNRSQDWAAKIAHRHSGTIYTSTAEKIAELYQRWCMTLPDETTGRQRHAAAYARSTARRHGWPPPLAWDEGKIDDPTQFPDWAGVRCGDAKCGESVEARGLCAKHYLAKHRPPTGTRTWSVQARLELYLDKIPGGCWIWRGARNKYGYGCMRGPEGTTATHRFVYEQLRGPIPEGLDLDHLCRVRSCANPAHLEPVTRQENVSRGLSAAAEVCRNGHPFDILAGARQERRCSTCEKRKRSARTTRDAARRIADRHADLDDLLDRGAGVSEACRVLGVTVTALEKWTGRHGRRDDFNTLRARETPPTYQQKKWTA